jgi:hypothetical protein
MGGGSGRRSPAKADGGVVRAKSGAGRSPPVADGRQGGRGGVGVLARLGKKREKGRKETGHGAW